MAQVNKYTDRAAYGADTARSRTQSAVSFIGDNGEMIYDGVNVVVGKPSAAIGDLAVFDKTDGAIKFIKSATILKAQIPANLTPLAVVYARQGERLLLVSLETAGNMRWAAPYETALSGFDPAGGTAVLRFANSSDVSVSYPQGATPAQIAATINSSLKAHGLSAVAHGGWTAAADGATVILTSNTYSAEWAVVDAVSGCTIRRTPEDKNYQTTLTGVLIEGSNEYVRRKNGVNTTHAGCNPEKFLQYYPANGTDTIGIKPGSSTIIRESAFTEDANPELVAAYPTYRDYLFGEHMIQYPAAYGAVLRGGRGNTAKIGGRRFVDIHGQSVPCYPAAAAALDYGVAVEGATTGLEAGWWLPSVTEIYLLMRDRALGPDGAENDPVNSTLVRMGAQTCYASVNLWSCCEHNTYVVFIYGGNAGNVVNGSKYSLYTVRPVSAV